MRNVPNINNITDEQVHPPSVIIHLLYISLVSLNSTHIETTEKQYKYLTNLACHGVCWLAVGRAS